MNKKCARILYHNSKRFLNKIIPVHNSKNTQIVTNMQSPIIPLPFTLSYGIVFTFIQISSFHTWRSVYVGSLLTILNYSVSNFSRIYFSISTILDIMMVQIESLGSYIYIYIIITFNDSRCNRYTEYTSDYNHEVINSRRAT